MLVSYLMKAAPSTVIDCMSAINFISALPNRSVIKYTPLEVIFKSTGNGVSTMITYQGDRTSMRVIYEVARELFDLEVDKVLGKLPESEEIVILALRRITGQFNDHGLGHGEQHRLMTLCRMAYESNH